MSATTGLSADPTEYRRRLVEQSATQIDAWSIELMRDLSIQRGVRFVLREFLAAGHLDERELERVYAAGGGPPASLGRTAEGQLMVPAVTLHCLVPGLRATIGAGAQAQLVALLVANFDEIVYI